MKKIILTLLSCLILLPALYAQGKHDIPIWKKMHYLSAEEMLLPHDNLMDFYPTDPPDHPVRMIAEFEQMQSVLVRYPFGIPTSLIVEMSQDCGVTTIVANQSQQNTVNSIYQGSGANMANIDYIQAPTDSYWTRDYGPWFVIDGNGEFGVCNFPYNRPRPDDDDIPIEVANHLGIELYGMPLEHTGGNWMCAGSTQGSSTELVWEENPGMAHQEIQDMVDDYLGIDEYHVLPDPLGEYIKHIDCWGKFLDVNKVLIGSVLESDPRYDDFEYVADYFAATLSDWGVPYEVYRVYTPGYYPNTPYTNSLILNKKVFVPITGSTYDADALLVYEAAMPGYEVIGIMYNSWENTDALHCRTKGIADIEMLHIKHMPLLGNIQIQDDYEIIATITAYSGSALYTDSVLLYYQVNGGQFQSVQMVQQLGNIYAGLIPFQDEGTEVGYYIHAADMSGRSMNHPYIGAVDPHVFTVVQMLPGLIVTPDTLLYTTYIQAIDGLKLRIYPDGDEDVIIDNINLEEWDVFYWWAEPIVTFPYLLPANDSLILTVYVGIPVDQSLGFVQDTMFIESEGGDHEVLIIVDEDLISKITVSNDPEVARISGIYPNPFSMQANFMISIAETARVSVYILDNRGRLIRILAENSFSKGDHKLVWDGRDENGIDCPAGIYHLLVKTAEKISTGKLIKR
ncbi:MAG: agmatine deiminase family protein [Bacteroidetes bacterium]|nr:agmatine deiminase family protein [Bacteroidota bacterium]